MWRRHTYYLTAVALMGPPSNAHVPLVRADHMSPADSERGWEMWSLAERHVPGTALHSGKGSTKLWGQAILPYTVSKAPTSYPCSPLQPPLIQSPLAMLQLHWSSVPISSSSLPYDFCVLFLLPGEFYSQNFFLIVLFNSQVSVQIPSSPQGSPAVYSM